MENPFRDIFRIGWLSGHPSMKVFPRVHLFSSCFSSCSSPLPLLYFSKAMVSNKPQKNEAFSTRKKQKLAHQWFHAWLRKEGQILHELGQFKGGDQEHPREADSTGGAASYPVAPSWGREFTFRTQVIWPWLQKGWSPSGFFSSHGYFNFWPKPTRHVLLLSEPKSKHQKPYEDARPSEKGPERQVLAICKGQELLKEQSNRPRWSKYQPPKHAKSVGFLWSVWRR